MRLIHITIFGLILVTCSACSHTPGPVISNAGNDETLYVLPDGKMEFNGRLIGQNDVIIYDAGSHGERAAVKLYLPLYSHAWRDSIKVERVVPELPIASTEPAGDVTQREIAN